MQPQSTVSPDGHPKSTPQAWKDAAAEKARWLPTERPWMPHDVLRAAHLASVEAAPAEPVASEAPADRVVVVDIPAGVIVKVVLIAILVWFALGAIGAAMLFALGAI